MFGWAPVESFLLSLALLCCSCLGCCSFLWLCCRCFYRSSRRKTYWSAPDRLRARLLFLAFLPEQLSWGASDLSKVLSQATISPFFPLPFPSLLIITTTFDCTKFLAFNSLLGYSSTNPTIDHTLLPSSWCVAGSLCPSPSP
jgi:hypothetical protein